ncbi:hypothetical protein [Herbidospora sp. RD11066]
MRRTSGSSPQKRAQIPGYRGIVVVDAENYTDRPSTEQEIISAAIPEILESSFDRAGLSAVWQSRKFPHERGDGYVFGFAPDEMPSVIHPWLGVLEDVLFELATPPAPIRFRVSLHIGPIPVEGLAYDGNGTPRNDVHRLVNADQLRAVLDRASPHVTRVVSILSSRCYEDAVLSGRTLHPDHFVEVSATVRGKQFKQQAWIYVPTPSGSLFDPLLSRSPTPDVESPGRTPPYPQARSATNWVSGGNLNTGVIHGDQTSSHYA